MLTIGQLARIFNVTAKTLRHYDAVGLFTPAQIGEVNQYRLYSPEQLPEIRRILALRAMGLGIEVISELRTKGTLEDAEKVKRILLEHANGISDGIAQQQKLLAAVHRMVNHISRSGGIYMEPRLIKKAAFRVVGMEWSNRSGEGDIPQLWDRFILREQEIQGLVEPEVSYGLCITGLNGDLTYIAGFESSETSVPQGMIEFTVPEQNYAIFTHTGSLSLLGETMEMIYSKWLPQHSLQTSQGVDFELYDGRFDGVDSANTQIDIYIPISN